MKISVIWTGGKQISAKKAVSAPLKENLKKTKIVLAMRFWRWYYGQALA
jgi:hypothetical protein